MYDLPEHLSSLNALAPSPSSLPVMDQSAEDAVWNYLNTDELFRNFGVQPSELQQKEETAEKEEKKSTAPSDLKSFIEQFAAEQPAFNNDFAMSIPSFGASIAATPAGISTADIMPQVPASPWDASYEDDRPSGAKRLKSIGAQPAEIEEE